MHPLFEVISREMFMPKMLQLSHYGMNYYFELLHPISLSPILSLNNLNDMNQT